MKQGLGKGARLSLRLEKLQGDYAICRLAADAPIPHWADGPGFVSISRAEDELSITCRSDRVPDKVNCEKGWAAMKLDNLLGLDEPGAVLSAVEPISTAGYGVFIISTYLRDYLLVRTDLFDEIAGLMIAAGHQFTPDP